MVRQKQLKPMGLKIRTVSDINEGRGGEFRFMDTGPGGMERKSAGDQALRQEGI